MKSSHTSTILLFALSLAIVGIPAVGAQYYNPNNGSAITNLDIEIDNCIQQSTRSTQGNRTNRRQAISRSALHTCLVQLFTNMMYSSSSYYYPYSSSYSYSSYSSYYPYSSYSSYSSFSSPQNMSVSIQNFSFQPQTITVRRGSTLTWTNQDSASHTVTRDASDGPMSPTLSSGQSYSYTFNSTGTFTYHCSIHPDMHGTVVVTD